MVQSSGTPSASSQPTRLILGGSQQPSQLAASNGVVTSPLTPAPGATGEPPANEANNASVSRILAALHNRGLVSQQNGKFYYVGGDQKKQVAVAVSGGGQSQVYNTSGLELSLGVSMASTLNFVQ